jgi:hypothetical protein
LIGRISYEVNVNRDPEFPKWEVVFRRGAMRVVLEASVDKGGDDLFIRTRTQMEQKLRLFMINKPTQQLQHAGVRTYAKGDVIQLVRWAGVSGPEMVVEAHVRHSRGWAQTI